MVRRMGIRSIVTWSSMVNIPCSFYHIKSFPTSCLSIDEQVIQNNDNTTTPILLIFKWFLLLVCMCFPENNQVFFKHTVATNFHLAFARTPGNSRFPICLCMADGVPLFSIFWLYTGTTDQWGWYSWFWYGNAPLRSCDLWVCIATLKEMVSFWFSISCHPSSYQIGYKIKELYTNSRSFESVSNIATFKSGIC